MARIRTVKPEFWTDSVLTECSRDARLLFIGAWNFADDKGGLDRSAKQLKGQVFPHDELDVEALIQELQRAGSLVEYEVDGKKYLHIKNFEKHQVINRPSPPRVPLYDCSLRTHTILPEHSVSHHGPLTAGLEGKGMEGNGREELRPSDVVEQKRSTDPVQEVFEHWKQEHGHPKAQLDPKRKRRIKDALKHFSTDQLCQAISGYRNSPHHMGTSPGGNGTKYDDIELFLRDTQHVEAGLELLAHPPHPQGPAEPKLTWRPPADDPEYGAPDDVPN